MERAILTVNHISYHYPGSRDLILSDVSFTVRKGEFVSLIGASGSGKSTIFRLLSGLADPDEGSISIEGAEHGSRLGSVALMPQKDLLLPWRTVLENVLLPVEISGKDRGLKKEQAREWLERFGLKDYVHRYPSQLSGGMRQRVAFLRTMMTGAELLLLDEPFGALDTLTRQEMQTWLLTIWEEFRKTVVFITHDIEEAVLLSDKVLVLSANKRNSGSITEEICREITIPMERPRRHELVFEPEFIAYRRLLSGFIGPVSGGQRGEAG